MPRDKVYDKLGTALYPEYPENNKFFFRPRQQVPGLVLVKRSLEVWYLGKGTKNLISGLCCYQHLHLEITTKKEWWKINFTIKTFNENNNNKQVQGHGYTPTCENSCMLSLFLVGFFLFLFGCLFVSLFLFYFWQIG